MSDANDIDKAEYDNLRAENLFHQTNASAIFGLNVVGLGVGVTASGSIDAALLVIAILSCVLWSRYSDHVMAVFRITAYIEMELRPRMVARLDEPVLGWESFLRGLPGRHARLPKLPSVDSRIGVLVSSTAFMLPPPLLCAAFVVQRWATSVGARRTVLITAVVLVLIVWLYSMMRTVSVVRWIRAADHRIVETIISPGEANR
ncbi:MAG TPA: hypothetical protein VHX38_17345 [Pseudonocardiaceae bacterium]|jgi:hypothetical protein|nr:hypothetical protein [Pseudonocardiaceae bacterium]